jgi:short-subunit dehydrogenase
MTSIPLIQKKIALITGASSGIGAKTAVYLSSKGLRVILVARREDKLKEICKSIAQKGGDAQFISVYLANEQDRCDLYTYLENKQLLPDILINNAGIGWYGYIYMMPWEIAKELIHINVEAVVHLSQLFLPSMLKNRYGHIINIGSIAGKLPEQGVALYAASKSFLDSFTTSVYRDLKGSHVSMSVLRAGSIKTEFFDNARKRENGRNIPAENLATSVESVARGVWSLIIKPQKVLYVPWYLFVSPLLETLFSKIIDLVGPLLLKNPKTREAK